MSKIKKRNESFKIRCCPELKLALKSIRESRMYNGYSDADIIHWLVSDLHRSVYKNDHKLFQRFEEQTQINESIVDTLRTYKLNESINSL